MPAPRVNPTEYLFVYGLLRKGFGTDMSRFLEKNATWLGLGYVHGRLFDLGKYPGLVIDKKSEGRVKGDVYLVRDPNVLKILDDFEGIGPGYTYPYEYSRVKGQIFLYDKSVDGWLYEYAHELGAQREIASGDYAEYIATPGG